MNNVAIVISIVILSLCYFSNVFEKFANIQMINPQGSWINNKYYKPSPISPVENWRINKNLYEPGTSEELNLAGLQTSFPYYKYDPETYNDKINLIKSDGVILGGYVPQIIRPFDSVTANPTPGSDCKWPCYSDRKFQEWCSEENAIKYHAMRPIISTKDYNNNLKKMFIKMLDRKGPATIPNNDMYEKIETAVFCTETQKYIMSWLMQKVALAVNNMPEMQRNGSWKSERFYETDVQMYQYINNKMTYFKIIFNLFNPLRSVATLVVATICMINNEPSLLAMDFVNEGSMEDYMAPQNGFGAITGHNVSNIIGDNVGIDVNGPLGVPNSPEGMQMWETAYKKNPNEFDWNYQNTLEVQKFNKEGFHSNVPGDNIKIEGGVPESLKKVLRDRSNSCKDSNLMSCMTPKYEGVSAPSARSLNEGKVSIDKVFDQAQLTRSLERLNGNVKNVYADPSLIYSTNKPISLGQIETIQGNIYI